MVLRRGSKKARKARSCKIGGLMAYSTLQQKTPLRAKTRLKTKTGLKSNSTLKSNRSLRDSYTSKVKAGVKKAPAKKPTYYKPKYEYKSIFTDDLTRCFITGDTKESGYAIHIHHVFGAANKTNSEKYHFLIPLRADWHDLASYGIHQNRELELKIKRMCQDYWLEHYGTKEEFIKVFGKWW